MAARHSDADAQFSALLAQFPPGVVALAKPCFAKLRRALPGTNEIVYDYGKSIVVSFSESDRGYEGLVTVKVQPSGVQLYFSKDVPDPQGRPGGSGGKVRFVTVESASELDRGDVHDLVQAAIRHAGARLPKAGATRMVFKSDSKMKSPKKTRRA